MTGAFGDGIPIPDVIDPPDSMPMTLCIPRNRDHMAAFFGALYQLTIWNSWQQNGTTQGKELAAVWWRYYLSWNRNMNDLECEDGMGNCCTEPAIIQRVNPITGNVEQSTNGGATWSPAAGGFQSVIVTPIPPVTSGVASDKCDAALNVNEQMGYWISHVSSNFDTAVTLLDFGIAIIGVIADAVLLILAGGTLGEIQTKILAILSGALTAVWVAGKSLFDDYWTSSVRDKIKCAWVEHIGDDGSYTEAQFSAAWNEINDKLAGSPAKMLFMGFLSSVGVAGINAMAASGKVSGGDCSDCSSTCNTDLWAVQSFHGTPIGAIVGRSTGYIDVQTAIHPDFGGALFAQIYTGDSTVCCTFDHIERISGDTSELGTSGVLCNEPLWPITNTHGFSVPAALNTFRVWSAGVSVFRIHFTD